MKQDMLKTKTLEPLIIVSSSLSVTLLNINLLDFDFQCLKNHLKSKIKATCRKEETVAQDIT